MIKGKEICETDACDIDEHDDGKSTLGNVSEKAARVTGAESGLAGNSRRPSLNGFNTARLTAVTQF